MRCAVAEVCGATSAGRGGRQVVARSDEVLGAGLCRELIVAGTLAEGFFVHFPRFECTVGEVLPEQDVQPVVDRLEAFIADEHNGLEAFEDHAYLGDGVPAVVAACGGS